MPTGSAEQQRAGQVVVTGLGRLGRELVLEALAAGHDVVGHDLAAPAVADPAGSAPAEHAAVADLRAATAGRRCRVVTELRDVRPDAVLVCPPWRHPAELELGSGAVEGAAVALARCLHPEALVLLVGTTRLHDTWELFACTVALLTGAEADQHYRLGLCLPLPGSTQVIVGAVDESTVTRATRLLRDLGRRVTAVRPPAVAVEIARLMATVAAGPQLRIVPGVADD